MKKVCLCGSTKFRAEFERVEKQLSLRGYIVYSCAIWPHNGEEISVEDKIVLDAVHLAKIISSDAVFVINPDGYLGESTMREVYFAKVIGKPIGWLHHGVLSTRMSGWNFRSEPRPCPPIPL